MEERTLDLIRLPPTPARVQSLRCRHFVGAIIVNFTAQQFDVGEGFRTSHIDRYLIGCGLVPIRKAQQCGPDAHQHIIIPPNLSHVLQKLEQKVAEC